MPILLYILRSIFLLLNLGAAAWLILCKWVSHADVSVAPGYLSLLSFTCFFALVANVFFIFFWLFSKKRKWLLLLSGLTIMVCWSVVKPVFGIHPFAGATSENTSGIKVMTWNVHLFDLGEWTRDKTSNAKIIKLIKDENPDILCLQEFFMEEGGSGEPYANIIRQLGYPYFKFSEESKMSKRIMNAKALRGEHILIGHAVFSKFPLQNDIRYPLGASHYNLLSVDVMVDSTHIFNLNVTHLASVRFGENDINYLESLKEKGTQAEISQKSKSIIYRLRNAFSIRAHQANLIDSIKDETDYPIIICGDFNDVPGSYVYQKVKGNLQDPFVAKGFGFGRTYRNIMPTLRIDYILYDGDYLQPNSYRSPNVNLSDHRPVIADFSFK